LPNVRQNGPRSRRGLLARTVRKRDQRHAEGSSSYGLFLNGTNVSVKTTDNACSVARRERCGRAEILQHSCRHIPTKSMKAVKRPRRRGHPRFLSLLVIREPSSTAGCEHDATMRSIRTSWRRSICRGVRGSVNARTHDRWAHHERTSPRYFAERRASYRGTARASRVRTRLWRHRHCGCATKCRRSQKDSGGTFITIN
jgi:hypothetical protein